MEVSVNQGRRQDFAIPNPVAVGTTSREVEALLVLCAFIASILYKLLRLVNSSCGLREVYESDPCVPGRQS